VSLALRNLLFTIVVPGAGAVYAPWLILTRAGANPQPVAWFALILVALGLGLYGWCLWLFATVGRGTPGPWDAPRRFVAVGPYRWVRNPIYIAALLVVVGEAWLFLSFPLLAYAGAVAVGGHLFVVRYEEPALHTLFGDDYDDYRHKVWRWIPRPPSTTEGPSSRLEAKSRGQL
jgi:protein-S-isoprenylcysteine O-methyltransferase Ste14